MRSTSEMMELIMNVIKNDKRIRAAELSGSRANPNAPVDRYQDFDVGCYVTDVSSYTKDHSWIDVFGERLMLQMPEAMINPSNYGGFNYQMLFTDGNRIDITLMPIENYNENNFKSLFESLTVLLIDKDGFTSPYPPASDKDYWIKPPNDLEYFSICNNFWWCLQNVAKGIKRDELPYAMDMYGYVRECFNNVISWYIGVKNNFAVAPGKMGKYFKNFLDERQYKLLCETYSDSNYDNFWNAIFKMCELFRETAKTVAEYFNFEYIQSDDDNMTEYLRHVRNLQEG